ncbi:recombinase family protein, partial [Enterococcus faecium]
MITSRIINKITLPITRSYVSRAFRYTINTVGMATVFLTNFIRCRTSFRMLFRLSLTMSLLGCDDLRQELTV